MHLVSCTNTHHDVTDFVDLGIAKNTKTWISWERNITFLGNKKFLTYTSDDTFWEVICFLAEVTFKKGKVFCMTVELEGTPNLINDRILFWHTPFTYLAFFYTLLIYPLFFKRVVTRLIVQDINIV